MVPPPDVIVYCYKKWQKIFEQIRREHPSIKFHQGVVDFDEFSPSQNNLVILDDLMDVCEKDNNCRNLFTVDSHHSNISVFFLAQNMFSKGTYFRTISLNSHYMIIFDNPRDRSQVQTIGGQIYPSNTNFFNEVYDKCIEKEHGYLFLDFKQGSKYRLQTGIIPEQTRFLFTPK